MKPFAELTEFGQVRRLRRLAEEVLQAYSLEVKRVRLLAYDTNFLYRIDCAAGKKYVLRIYTDDNSSLAETRTEVFWLNALRRDTDLQVVRVVPRADGAFINITDMPGVSPGRRSVLFDWVPGRSLDDQLRPEYYHQLGRMTARLHQHARALSLPDDIQPKRWDKIFYYPQEEAIYRSRAYRRHFNAERTRLLDEAIARGDDLLASLYQRGRAPILIHADLHPGNIHVFHGQLTLLDFEDITLGYPEQDVAITLYYGRTRPDYADLVAAYKAGYCSVCPWPLESEAQLAILMASRSANFINYAARTLEEPEDMLPSMFTRLQQSLEIAKNS